MIVCSCCRVSDRTVVASVLSGATSVQAVTAACGAGSRCGACRPELERIIESHVAIRGTAHTSAA